MRAIGRHWRPIGGVLLLLAAISPMVIVSEVWRVWEGWTLTSWGWALNITNDFLLASVIAAAVGAICCFAGRRKTALAFAISALVFALMSVIGYIVLNVLLVGGGVWQVVSENLKYWLLGKGYDAGGNPAFFPSSVFGGPVSWLLLLAGIVVVSAGGRTSALQSTDSGVTAYLQPPEPELPQRRE